MSPRSSTLTMSLCLSLLVTACGSANNDSLMVNGEEKDTGLRFESDAEKANDPKAPEPPAGAIPAMVDLRSSLPPPGDQGEIGSCAAWTLGYGLATFYAGKVKGWALNTPDHQASAGPLYLRVLDKIMAKCDEGTPLDENMNELLMNGTPSLAVAPYNLKACTPNQPTTDAANFKIGSWGAVAQPQDRNALKRYLAAGTPLGLASRLPDNFDDYKSGVFKGSTTQSTGKHSGHAMVLAGYDDARSAFLIMNSWKSTWAEGGYMWWDYADFEKWNDQAVVTTLPTMMKTMGAARGTGATTSALQYDGASGAQHLLFWVDAGESLWIDSVEIADPQGNIVTQDYGKNAFREGPMYVSRNDGLLFAPGRYELRLQGHRQNGEVVERSGTANITAAAGRETAGFTAGIRGVTGALVE